MLYGTSYYGGTNGYGAIYEFNPSNNTCTAIYSFTGTTPDGKNPSVLTYDSSNGMFYGTTDLGGTNGNGTIYEFNPSSNALTTLYSFSSADGEPISDLVYVSSTGMFYGSTNVGISYSHGGSIFEFNP